MKIVILAGGGGTRLWPVSRKSKPKQIQPFIGNKTLLQKTYDRVKSGYKIKDILISTNYKQYPLISKQLSKIPRENYVLETEKRDTAAAIGLAATYIAKDNPKEVMMLTASDHYIKNEKEFIRISKLAEKIIKEDPKQSVVIGLRPTYPETGYGYIKMNKLYKQYDDDEVFYAQKFVEKPDLATAQKYAKSWDYLWNASMFSWRADYILSLFKRFLPDHYEILMKIQPALGTKNEKKVVEKEYKKMKSISIDYGIMERTKKIVVIPASFDWADVGHWRAVKDILSKQSKDNVVRGKHVDFDSEGSLIYSYTGKLVATAGLKDMIVVDTEDCLLVCSKDKAQDVKQIVAQLNKKKMKKYL
ncbi:MAG: sugar phosphate nucleotidyltransferase [candidate division Zixibacteria bacterium]|nr:sugar phosphate nucleotidyltransferase [candidate division Zixibacteria bacterium]